jgi:hypothetical protein
LVAYAAYPVGNRRRNDFHCIATILAVDYFGSSARPPLAEHWSSSSVNSEAAVARKKVAIGPHYRQHASLVNNAVSSAESCGAAPGAAPDTVALYE